MVPCWIRYSERKSRGGLGGASWKVRDCKTQNVKILLKTNANGHKYPSNSLIIIEQVTIGETKENNKWHSTQGPCTLQKQSYRLWWGAALPILRDTPCVCIYTSYNHNSYQECIRIDKYVLTQNFWSGHCGSNPPVSAVYNKYINGNNNRITYWLATHWNGSHPTCCHFGWSLANRFRVQYSVCFLLNHCVFSIILCGHYAA